MKWIYRALGKIEDAYYWCHRKIHILRYGFDYRDVWGMDDALANWLIPRLRHLASVAHGCPAYYSLSEEEIVAAQEREMAGDYSVHDPLFDIWIRDILIAAQSLQDWLDYENGDGWELDVYKQKRDQASKAFKWVADNIWGLWD